MVLRQLPDSPRVQVADRWIGLGEPLFVIAEIGINHNGCLDTAKKLIEGASFAGCDAVKFQKRDPEICVPRDQWEIERETPWGRMTYIEYRHRMEFGEEEFAEIDRFCRDKGMIWFASCWDENSVDFMETFKPPLYKVASASLTDHSLLVRLKETGRPLMVSTGMSTMEEIQAGVSLVDRSRLLLAHSTSAYPCPIDELNLRMIPKLTEMFPDVPIGYSGHEVGLAPSWAAVALGATFVERHITLDRSMWGSDQGASVEPMGMHQLVRNARDIEKGLGTGIKTVFESEVPMRRKLRRVTSVT